jgi:hypothetical protein
MAEGQENKRTKSIQQSAKEILQRAEAREEAGQHSFEARWQASLEMVLLMAEESLRLGRLLPTRIDGQEEWEFYQEVLKELDLPPKLCAVLITPSAVKAIPITEVQQTGMDGVELSERDSFSIIISDCTDHKAVMQVSLPGLESVGIDVFEHGRQLANYTYNTMEECLSDLTDRVCSSMSLNGVSVQGRGVKDESLFS